MNKNQKEVPVSKFLDMPEQNKTITTLSSRLDKFFDNGILAGVVTEIAGKAGTGKTQLALHLALTSLFSTEIKELSIRKDASGKIITSKCFYICGPMTPKHQLLKRVRQMEIALKNNLKAQKYPKPIQELCNHENIMFVRCSSLEEVLNTLEKVKYVENNRIIIVDSVADFFKGQDEEEKADDTDSCSHAKLKLGGKLFEISVDLNLPVLALNHVSQVFDETETHRITLFEKNQGYRACLGERWAQWLTGGRYYLLKDDQGRRKLVDESDGTEIGVKIKSAGVCVQEIK